MFNGIGVETGKLNFSRESTAWMLLLIKQAAVDAEVSFINIFTCNLVKVINPSIHYSALKSISTI